MKIFFKYLSVIFFLIICLKESNVSAESVDISSEGFTVKALIILTLQEPGFGTIEKPISTVTAGITTRGITIGSANYIDYDNAKEGQYKIYGSASQSVNISAADNNTYSFIRFTSVKGSYSNVNDFEMLNGRASLPAPGLGTILYVGPTITISPQAEPGDYSPVFTITINYD